MSIGLVKRRRKGVISLSAIDPTINAETSQPTIQGKPCLNCRSRVKYAKRPGKIRGMLCLHCNSGLGSFRDDPARLSAAIEYLRTC